ncbi:thiol reductant ABC exporter subunit CydD [Roseomonas eburnea]|uniref:Thiol reductant ABC exporter subunit CydD n=1 Tax=Neoroseomonas eburnea TaxID=1346889 RepID=A0A9X9XD04_9PROT|nr:thiol reductant ABC exporter subunit CydD [Neoroseomonas eburnea]MBR0681590.1 thiol reductant ABC exporter subunit CydD [Neoroseomonas eburnea]
MPRTPLPKPHVALRDAAAPLRHAGLIQSAAALLWLPQAALLAGIVGSLAAGGGVGDALLPAGAILLLGLARAGLDALGARIAFRAARGALTRLRAEAVAVLAARSPLDAGRPSSGAAAAALAEQAEAVLPYLLRFRTARLRTAIVPPVLLLAVLTQSWAAALVLLFAAPLIPIFMALIGLRAQEASEAQMLEIGGMNALLLDRLRGLSTIRAFDAVDATAARLRAAAEGLRHRSMAVLRIAFLSSAVLELFAALGVAMVAVYVGFHLLGALPFGAWGGTLGLGPALFVLLLAPAFFEPLRDLAAAWHDRAAGEAALGALAGLAAPPAVVLPDALDAGLSAQLGCAGCSMPAIPERAAVPDGARSLAPVAAVPPLGEHPPPPGLEVDDLVFRYPGTATAVFNGFSLTVAPGEHVALFAESGGGKSTLLALLAGLALPEAGRIAIGGQAMAPGTAAALRARIAWLGQRPHLFAGSLRANIALGRAGAGTEAARAALLPGLPPDRPIGEGGAGLSGGEALRLGLARAIAGAGASLILADEPTAHLDRATAADATEALLQAAKGRTLVLATHDPVLAARMDRVVRLP